MTAGALPGMDAGAPPKRRPRTWGIEICPVPMDGAYPPSTVRLTLIDQETGRRVGAKDCPWDWFRDCARGTVLVQIAEGVWS